jgi:hypothetical protein
LPPWSQPLRKGDGYDEFAVADGCCIRFIPLDPKVHFTSYKPQFMLDLWGDRAREAESMFYFDPDITVKCDWQFIADWVDGGVALCEDVNSPMPSSHPIRNAWRSFFRQRDERLSNPIDIYVNAGFIGLKREHTELLDTWKRYLAILAENAKLMNQLLVGNRLLPFYNQDQDALNAVLMVCGVPLSLVSRDGMDFARGGYIMSHSIGGAKPWRGKILSRALGGFLQAWLTKAIGRTSRRRSHFTTFSLCLWGDSALRRDPPSAAL